MDQIIAWINYYGGIIFFLIMLFYLIVVFISLLSRKKARELFNCFSSNQEEMVKLLKEIRDLLKK